MTIFHRTRLDLVFTLQAEDQWYTVEQVVKDQIMHFLPTRWGISQTKRITRKALMETVFKTLGLDKKTAIVPLLKA
jgi:hypothetical protein